VISQNYLPFHATFFEQFGTLPSFKQYFRPEQLKSRFLYRLKNFIARHFKRHGPKNNAKSNIQA